MQIALMPYVRTEHKGQIALWVTNGSTSVSKQLLHTVVYAHGCRQQKGINNMFILYEEHMIWSVLTSQAAYNTENVCQQRLCA